MGQANCCSRSETIGDATEEIKNDNDDNIDQPFIKETKKQINTQIEQPLIQPDQDLNPDHFKLQDHLPLNDYAVKIV